MPNLSEVLRRDADPKLSTATLAYRALAAYLMSIKTVADAASVSSGEMTLSGPDKTVLQLIDGSIWARIDQEADKVTHIGLHSGKSDDYFAIYRHNRSGKLQRIR